MNKKILCFVAIVASFFATNILAATGKISVARAFFELARQNNTQKIEGLLHRGYSLESLDIEHLPHMEQKKNLIV